MCVTVEIIVYNYLCKECPKLAKVFRREQHDTFFECKNIFPECSNEVKLKDIVYFFYKLKIKRKSHNTIKNLHPRFCDCLKCKQLEHLYMKPEPGRRRRRRYSDPEVFQQYYKLNYRHFPKGNKELY